MIHRLWHLIVQVTGRVLGKLGGAYYFLDDYAKAIEYHQQSLAIAQKTGDCAGEGHSLRKLGGAYYSLGNYAKAIEYFQQSLTIARTIGDCTGEGKSLRKLGFAYYFLSDYAKAIEYSERSLAITQKISDRAGEGKSLRNLGGAYASLGDYTKAIEYSERSLAIAQKIGDRTGEGHSLRNLGGAYASLGDYAKAINYFQQSLTIARTFGNPVGEGHSLGNLGGAYYSLGDYAKAIDYFQQHLTIARTFGNRAGEGHSLTNLGSAYASLGDYAKAIDYHQKSLTIARTFSNRAGEGHSLGNLGSAYASLGDYAKAIDYFQQSLTIAQKIGNRAGERHSLGNLGSAYYSLGDYTKAIEYSGRSLTIAQKIGDRSGEGNSLGNLGSAYASLGDYAKAIDYFQQHLTIAQKIGDQAREGNSLGNLGIAYYSLGDYAKAIEYHQQSLTIAQKIGDQAGEGNSLGNLGIAYYSLGNYAKAIEYHQQSLTIAQKIGNQAGEGNSLGNLGSAYASLGDYAKAIEYLQQHLTITQRIGDLDGEGTVLNALGTTLLHYGSLPEAERILGAAIEAHEAIRKRLGSNDGFKVSIFERQVQSYKWLQIVLVRQHKPEKALEIAERGRARAFVELLVSRLSANPDLLPDIDSPNIKQIQQIAFEQNATLIEYSLLPDEVLYIWVIQPTGQVTFRQVDLNLNTPLRSLVLDSRQSIGVRSRGQTLAIVPGDFVKLNDDAPNWEPWQVVAVDAESDILSLWQSSFPEGLTIPRPVSDVAAVAVSGRTHHPHLQQLHQLLIAPIADLLPTAPEAHVIFFPQGELFLVPFPALQDAQGTYLVEKHTILTAPAIQVLELTRHQRQQVQEDALDILVVGNPTMPKVSLVPGDPPQPLAPLPHSEQEAQGIAQLFQTQALIGDQATKAAIVQQLPNARIIHLATHGLLDNVRGMGSAIALAPSGTDNGLLTAEEILELNLNAELVVLSACNTGQGRLTGDGIVGLSRSFISAGTPSVIVSLWAVPDAPTAALMTEFYRDFLRTGNKAQALRQAMLATMQQYPHPKDWAAFTLIGEAE